MSASIQPSILPASAAEADLVESLREALLSRLAEVPGVVSVTIVGSFVDRSTLQGISDVDTVVVLDRLSVDGLSRCREVVESVAQHPAIGTRRFYINDTFGPLKFDATDCAVVHLMVYDVASHRDHVVASPFTCLDWERSAAVKGRRLREIYPVLNLQPGDFVQSRRGLQDYLADLAAGVVTFRKYEVVEDCLSQVIAKQPIDQRHAGEFAYHIIKNCVGNALKLWHADNRLRNGESLAADWADKLPLSASFLPFFRILAERKLERAQKFPEDTLAQTAAFLRVFEQELRATWQTRARRVVFIRHARTSLNDGSFLGQRRDPAILEAPARDDENWMAVWSSPLQRTRMTANALVPAMPARIDSRLVEIDYGLAEGLTFAQFAERHPDVVSAWKRREDASFPSGENNRLVLDRLENFLGALPDALPAVDGAVLVVTHNVVLRCLVGKLMSLPITSWHRIPIGHLERFEVRLLDGNWYANFSREQKARIVDAIVTDARWSDVAEASTASTGARS